MRPYLLLLSIVMLYAVSANAQCTGPVIINYPYHEDFEASQGGWTSGGTGDDWAWGTPNKMTINSAASGSKCWVSGGLTASFYTLGERSYVESPCFNFTALAHPYIRFKIWWESEYHFDGTNLQYSLDQGLTWTNVGSINDPVNCLNNNWYNYPSINYLSGLATVREGWSGNIQQNNGICVGGNGSGGWVEAKHCMTELGGQPSVRFRFTFGAGTSCNDFDGVAFDDIYVQNAPPIVASFVPSCSGPNTYTFNDISTICPDLWNWNFGDPASGSANTSTLQNPTHTYPGPGVYTVTLSADNLCSGTTTAVRTVKIYDVVPSVTPVTCHGDNDGSASIQLVPTAGNPMFEWNTVPIQTGPTATNLAAGTYMVSLIETGVCPAMATVIVPEPPILQHTTTLTNASCGNANGSATIVPSGGTAPYTYLWSPAVSTTSTAANLLAGNYSVTVKDAHGCTDVVTFTLTGSPGIQASISNTVAATCFGSSNGSATVLASGGTPGFTYAWSPGAGTGTTISGLTAGNYTVTVTDAMMCTTTAVATITQPPVLQHTVTTQQATCGNANGSASIVETGGTLPYTYSWSPSGGNSNMATNLATGNYVLSITDQHGCTDTVQVHILNSPPVQAIISNVTQVDCFGAATGSATATVSGGTAPFTYMWSPSVGNTATVNGLNAGAYQVTVTDAKLCTATATVTVSQPPVLQHTSMTVSAACNSANGSATIMETGGTTPYNYNWSPMGGTGATANNLTAGNYIVTITDNHNCIDTAQIVVGNIGGVQASISSTVPVSCFGGQNGSATVAATGGALPYTYTWSPTGGNGPTANGLSAGNYFVTVTDANLCVAAVAASITQPPVFQHTTTVQPSICGGANGSATVMETGGTAPYTYLWLPMGGTGSMAQNLTAGNYVVSITDAHNCLDTVQIVVGTLPSVQLAVINTVQVACFGAKTGSATVSASSGSAPYSYNWSMGINNSTAVGLAAGIYTVTVTDANLCTATAVVTITQPAPLQNYIVYSDAACDQSNGTIVIHASGGIPPYSYNWSSGGSIDSFAINLPFNFYRITITDQLGCKDTAQVNIYNAPGVQAAISNQTNINCFGEKTGMVTVLATVGPEPLSYVWSPVGGNNATADNLLAGTYTVTVTDGNHCTATATATITQPSVLMNNLVVTPVSCGGTNGSAIITETGGTSPYTYNWSPTGGNAATASNLAAGNYVVSVVDKNGCSDTVQVTVGMAAPLQASIANISAISCFGVHDGSLTAAVTGGVMPYTYAWTPVTGNTAMINGLAAGSYSVTVSDLTGCTSVATANLSDATLIETQAHATPVRCFGETNGTITVDTTQGGVEPYLYALGQTAFSPQKVFTQLAGNTYFLQTQDANGCIVYDTIAVQEPIINTVNIGPDTTINIGDILLLSAIIGVPGNVVTYEWTPPATITCSSCASTSAQPFTTTTYTLQITDRAGCTTSDSRVVKVNGPSVYIPNVFDPSGNGQNDHFTVYAGFGVQEVDLLQVYDRWGELVFENQHFAPSGFDGWNGKVRGKPAPTGVYVYVCRVLLLDGTMRFLKGDVTVVR